MDHAMTSEAEASRTAGDIRDYLLRQLNSALRRPGMFGAEIALRLYFDAIAFTDRGERAWAEDRSALRSREAFVSTGVTGAVERALGHRAEDVMASVYAEIAHQHAWLTLDSNLPEATTTACGTGCQPGARRTGATARSSPSSVSRQCSSADPTLATRKRSPTPPPIPAAHSSSSTSGTERSREQAPTGPRSIQSPYCSRPVIAARDSLTGSSSRPPARPDAPNSHRDHSPASNPSARELIRARPACQARP